MLLFYPTKTVSERHALLKAAKTSRTFPGCFIESYPKLSGLILRMLSPVPAKRPTIIELMNDPIFCQSFAGVEIKRKLSGGNVDGELLVKKGQGTVWKIRYVKLVGENLYLYKKRGDQKARAWYSLNACLVNAEKKPGEGAKFPTSEVVARIDHENLESLYVRFKAGDKNYRDWLDSLNLSEKVQYVITRHSSFTSL